MTAEIPPATLAELKAAQLRLKKRDTTLVGGAIVADDPRAPEQSAHVSQSPPSAPIPRAQLEAALDEQLALFAPGCREAFLRSFSARSYLTAVTLLDDAVKLQPRNLTMAKAASAVRHFAVSRLELDLGALHASVRALKPLPTSEASAQVLPLLKLIDDRTSIETLLRSSKVNRLVALSCLADLARSGHIELWTTTAPAHATMRLPPMPSSGAHALSEEVSKVPPLAGKSSRPPARERVAAGDEFAAPPRADARPRSQPAESARPPVDIPLVSPPGGLLPDAAAVAAEVDAPPAAPAEESRSGPESRTVSGTLAPRVSCAPRVEAAIATPPAAKRAFAVNVALLVAAALGGALVLGLILQNRRPEAAPPPPPGRWQAGALHTQQSVPPALAPAANASATAAPTVAIAASNATIAVRIKVEPAYARVSLDGVLLTKSPIEVVIPKDGENHEVVIEALGFRSKKLTFVASSDQSVIASLDKSPAATPTPPKPSSASATSR